MRVWLVTSNSNKLSLILHCHDTKRKDEVTHTASVVVTTNVKSLISHRFQFTIIVICIVFVKKICQNLLFSQPVTNVLEYPEIIFFLLSSKHKNCANANIRKLKSP